MTHLARAHRHRRAGLQAGAVAMFIGACGAIVAYYGGYGLALGNAVIAGIYAVEAGGHVDAYRAAMARHHRATARTPRRASHV